MINNSVLRPEWPVALWLNHVENMSSIFGFVKGACVYVLVRFSRFGSPTTKLCKNKMSFVLSLNG